MECSVLDMLYQLNLSLLEIIFVYIVKMSQNERFSLSAHISSLQLVTGLPNSNKGRTKGHILISGPWDGLYEGSGREFYPRCSLEIPNRICFYNPYLSFVVISFWLWTYCWSFMFVWCKQEQKGLPCKVCGEGLFWSSQQDLWDIFYRAEPPSSSNG